MKRIVFVFGPLLVFCFAIAALHVDAMSSDADEVWAGEEAYWKYVKAHDNEGFRSLWAEDFVGWPIVQEHPIHKSDITLTSGALGETVDYRLQRENVDMHGSTGITFYRAVVRRKRPDGSEVTVTSRFTHTWMRQNGKWMIVGGMSTREPQATTVPQL